MDPTRKTLALSFDADQTLWDFSGVYEKALDATVTAMVEDHAVDRHEVSADRLRRVRDEVLTGYSHGPHSLEEVRERSFEVFLERVGHPSPRQAAQELAGLYLRVRFEAIELYPEVSESLARLKEQFRLGLLTNGNTYPDRCGLPGVFDAEVYGPTLGLAKPDPRLFHQVAEQLGVDVSHLMHIGDSEEDIEGANAVGAQSVFINRQQTSPAFAAEADHEIANLLELEQLLGGER